MLLGCFRWTEPAAPHFTHNHWRKMTLLHILLSILGTLSWATEVAPTAPPVDIYWNRTNDIFLRSNNDHIVEVKFKEQIKFHCPYYENTEESAEHYIIYRLPKRFYDECYIPVNANENQLRTEYGIEKVHNCSSPYFQSAFTSYIRDFGALPGRFGGLVYESGQEYYFTSISTGSRDGIHNKNSANSACKNYNMKAIVRVCCNDSFTNPPIFTGEPPTHTPPSTKPAATASINVRSTTIRNNLPSSTDKEGGKELKTTTAKASRTDPYVGDSSSTLSVASVLTLALSLIFSRIALELT